MAKAATTLPPSNPSIYVATGAACQGGDYRGDTIACFINEAASQGGHIAKAGLTQPQRSISMAQANSLSPIGLSAVKVLARLAAKRAVQDNLRAQGVRVSLFPHAELMRQAGEYLASHPELYVAAHERAQRMTAEGVFGKRAQRAYLKTNAQTETQPKSITSTLQISGAK